MPTNDNKNQGRKDNQIKKEAPGQPQQQDPQRTPQRQPQQGGVGGSKDLDKDRTRQGEGMKQPQGSQPGADAGQRKPTGLDGTQKPKGSAIENDEDVEDQDEDEGEDVETDAEADRADRNAPKRP